MVEFVPKGYLLYNDRLINAKTFEWTFLRNRTFKEINHSYRKLLSRLIAHLVNTNGHDSIKILDIGGGTESRSARDIVCNFGSAVKVTNTDLIAQPRDKIPNFNPISASALQLPFKDESFDLVYSRQLLGYFEEPMMYSNDKNNRRNTEAFLNEVLRIIKPGGVAIVDSQLEPDNETTKSAIAGREIVLAQKDLGIFLSPSQRLHKLIEPNYWLYSSRDPFLVMQKMPINPSVQTIIDRVPVKIKPWRTV